MIFLSFRYIMFGSMIFGMWEKWDQLDGAYFCFISLSRYATLALPPLKLIPTFGFIICLALSKVF